MTQEYCVEHGHQDFVSSEDGLLCPICGDIEGEVPETQAHLRGTVRISLSIKALHTLARKLEINPVAWTEQDLGDLIGLTLEREANLRVIPGYATTRTETRALLKAVKQ